MKLNFLFILALLFFYAKSEADNPVIGETYFIESAVGFNNRFLQVEGGNPNRRAPININVLTTGLEQHFTLRDAGDGWFYIQSNTQNKRAIHVEGLNRNSQANVNLWEIVNQDNLKWKFVPAGSDYYFIESKLGTYLDVINGSPKKKTSVWMYTPNRTTAQKWKLHNVDHPLNFKREFAMKNFGGKCISSENNQNPNGKSHIDASSELNVDMTYHHDDNSIYATVILTIGTNGFDRNRSTVYATWTETIFSTTAAYTIKGFAPNYSPLSTNRKPQSEWQQRITGMILPEAGA